MINSCLVYFDNSLHFPLADIYFCYVSLRITDKSIGSSNSLNNTTVIVCYITGHLSQIDRVPVDDIVRGIYGPKPDIFITYADHTHLKRLFSH
jgi:hypothetical protein